MLEHEGTGVRYGGYIDSDNEDPTSEVVGSANRETTQVSKMGFFDYFISLANMSDSCL